MCFSSCYFYSFEMWKPQLLITLDTLVTLDQCYYHDLGQGHTRRTNKPSTVH